MAPRGAIHDRPLRGSEVVLIRIRKLQLAGPSDRYEVSFLADSGQLRHLGIIAGEITTGKTAVLEFIDFCLGQDRHPSYVEIQRHVRSALLEVDLSGEIRVIERQLFAHENFAWVHDCSLDTIGEPHETRKLAVGPAGDSKSLNWLLLQHSGLEGVVLKEAPTSLDSTTDPLSFRDVMWLAFLPADRLTRRRLLHESGAPMKQIKLRQLIEVVFGVHDQQLASMGERIALLERERDAHAAEIQSLQTFLKEQETPDRLQVLADLEAVERDLGSQLEHLQKLDSRMEAETGFAHETRKRYAEVRRAVGQVTARIRDRETLLRRLLPLRGQYAEDERKLAFFSEAKRLFDPLSVRVCPSCLQELSETPEIKGGRCSLCDQELAEVDDPIDVEAERAAIRVRLRAVGKYIDEVEEELATVSSERKALEREEAEFQRVLDSDLAETLAPYVAQRDALVRDVARSEARRGELSRQLSWLEAVDRRTAELVRLSERITELRAERSELESNRPSRDLVVADLTKRFDGILRDFGFPKLDDPEPPFLDSGFVPHVRGLRYDELGSRGAVTLVALAWQLAIFERAVESDAPHPGFLMIDSPQTSLKPPQGQAPDEFSKPDIVLRLWHHIAQWSGTAGSQSQLLIVDHAPPSEVSSDVVVRFSGDAEAPPYGLIDNEAGG
jgi:septal ring factor EnvC (AmiA/AmiB activator)